MEHSIAYEFFRNAGFKVYCSPSAEWYMIQEGMLMSIPYNKLISPSSKELDILLKESGALGLRFPTDVENYGFESKIEICENYDYGLQYLKHDAKNRVNKGQKNCEFKSVTVEELRSEGFQLNLKTLDRQGRKDPKGNRKYWDRICDGLSITSGVKIWGSYCQNHLAAYVVVFEMPEITEMVIQNSDSDYLQYCPNNLLTYNVARHYLVETEKKVPLCYGLGSLEETPGLDDYKIRMGFTLKPIKQQIYFRKEIRWLLCPSLLKTFRFFNLNIFKGKNYKFDKSYALLKRYLEQK